MTVHRRPQLATVEVPLPQSPTTVPEIPAATFAARLDALVARLTERGLDALVVYGDREHFANLAYLTGFDPRWEESLLVVVPGRTPALLVGNEDVAYASAVRIPVEVIRFSKFSLVGQPDPEGLTLDAALGAAGLADRLGHVGVVGWKYWRAPEASAWIDVPHYIVEAVRVRASDVENAADLFVDPDGGLRTVNDADQIASFEFAATHASAAVLRLLDGVRPGMSELEASALMRPVLLPFSYHPTVLSGATNTARGVASPGGRVLETGDPMAAGLGYWGGNTARAGYLVEDATQLPQDHSDYVERVVLPYYATAAAWLETIRIGMTAGELYDVTASRLGDDFFGVFLNPGHLIHLDEWPSSPVQAGSPTALRSGQVLQLDIIPAPADGYHTAQIEDGVALADAGLRAAIAAAHPETWDRIVRRRTRLAEVFGITLHDDVLPLSDSIGYLPPFWLSPGTAVVMA